VCVLLGAASYATVATFALCWEAVVEVRATGITLRPRARLGGCELRSCRRLRGLLGSTVDNASREKPQRGLAYASCSCSGPRRATPQPRGHTLVAHRLVCLTSPRDLDSAKQQPDTGVVTFSLLGHGSAYVATRFCSSWWDRSRLAATAPTTRLRRHPRQLNG